MSQAKISAGICGFDTCVTARMVGARCQLGIESDCAHIREMASRLAEVDPLREISFRGEGPLTLRVAAECCRHPACPVPIGILKAIEVESGLALPADVEIIVSRGEATC